MIFSIGGLFYLLLKKNFQAKERLLTLYIITTQKGVLRHHAESTPKAHILFLFKVIVFLTTLQKFIWGLSYL